MPVKLGDHVKTPDGLRGRVIAFPTRTGVYPRVRVLYDPGQEDQQLPAAGFADYPRYLLKPLQEEEGPDD